MSAPPSERRSTPLLALHQRLGARLTEFAGWEMPLQHSGVIAEHTAVRERVGVFDVSHLGKLRLTGPDAADALDRALTADVNALEPGAAAYSLVLTEVGTCIDDVFIYRIGDQEWLVVPNAANVGAVADAIRDAGGEPVDEWDRWAILAIQGPKSFAVVDAIWPASGATGLKLHRWTSLDLYGRPGFIARTGYTGERGFELYAPSDVAERAYEALLDRGASPVGLGARDTLRLEMGYALYGHELTLDTDPLEAGLGWVLAWDTPFRGRERLLEVKARGPSRSLFGIRCMGKGVPRQGYRVVHAGEPVAVLTSGNFSPTLNTGIALALGPAGRAPAVGAAVDIEARGRVIEGVIVKPPFIEKRKKIAAPTEDRPEGS